MFRPYKQEESDLESEQTLLYVHQKPWQKELLKRHNNFNGCYIQNDKVRVTLFFIAVKTNVGYSPVADFVVQSETTIESFTIMQC